MVSAIVVGAWIVNRAAQTTSMYVAAKALIPGQQVQVADVNAVDVRLDPLAEVYLRADPAKLKDVVVTRPVLAGELIPLSAIGKASDVDSRTFGLKVTGPLASTVVPGALVDVWVTKKGSEPKLLGHGLTVVQVDATKGAFSSTSQPVVHVLVPKVNLPEFLTAVASDGAIAVVPLPKEER